MQAQSKVVCSRCNGVGGFAHYSHVRGGVCFRCDGFGIEDEVVPSAESKPSKPVAYMRSIPDFGNVTITRLTTSRYSLVLPSVSHAVIVDVVGDLVVAVTPGDWERLCAVLSERMRERRR